MRAAASPPPPDWLKQALEGQARMGVGCGPLSMPSEEECLVMATQWALPSAEGVCALRAPRPFSVQSSEQPDQFTAE